MKPADRQRTFRFTPGPIYPDSLLGRLRRLGSPLAREHRLVDRIVSPLRRPADRAWYAYSGKLRALGRLGESVSRAPRPPTGKRVLVLALRMWAPHTAYESVIGQALRLRGADVALLTCGGGQPICEVGWGRRIAPRPCDRCAYFTDRVATRGRFPLLRLADEFPWGAAPDRAPLKPDGSTRLSPRETALPSVAWFTRSPVAGEADRGGDVHRDFEVSVAAVEDAAVRIVDRFRPDVIFALNGLFAAERTVRAAAAERGIRVVTYEIAPRHEALIFADLHAAPEMVMDGLAEDQMSRPLSHLENEALDRLLEGRVTGKGTHERYFDRPLAHGGDAVRQALGIRGGTRVVSAFTNLAWDTALFGADLAFASQFDWLASAVELVASREEMVLVIRIHPAEARWGSAQPAERELAQRFGRLPANVRVVRPDEPLSSYGLLSISDIVLCYTTTVGLEAAVRGVSAVVGARTHYRGRGFTIDVDTRDDLERAIATLPRVSPDQIELARRYAFAFFFRLMIPFRQVRNVAGRLAHVPHSGEELLPGRDPLLDFVCDRILEGGEFFLPSELALEAS